MSKSKCCKENCIYRCNFINNGNNCHIEKRELYINKHLISVHYRDLTNYDYEYSKIFIETKINLYENLTHWK